MRKCSWNFCPPGARIRDSARPPVVWLVLLNLFLSPLVTAVPSQNSRVDFQRQIRPLLSDTCFQCHGPDPQVRVADLRLDLRENIFQARTSGVPVVPGDPDNSLIFRRITHEDANHRMPPAYSQKRLSDDQIDLIRRWIEQGAVWQQHWAFIAPRRPGTASGQGHLLAQAGSGSLRPQPPGSRRTGSCADRGKEPDPAPSDLGPDRAAADLG